MSTIIFDCEADGFVAEATQMHIIVTKDFETGQMYHWYDDKDLAKNDFVYHRGTCADGLFHILSYSKAVCHNYIGYDLPLILKLYPWYRNELGIKDNQYCTESNKIVDTLVLSRMMDPDRKKHTVDSYGKEFGRAKPEHEDWSKLTTEMIHRCHEDVEIQSLIYQKFCIKAEAGSWKESIQMEHELSEICCEMANNRWKFDRVKAEGYKESLTKRMAEIEAELDPLLPAIVVNEKELKSVFLKSGEYNAHITRWIEKNDIPAKMWPVGPITRIRFERISLYSTSQIKDWLADEGWEPDEWNYKKDRFNKFIRDDRGNLIRSSPKITESSLDALVEKCGKTAIKLVSEFFKCKHRSSLLQGKNKQGKSSGFLTKLDSDDTIRADIIPCGTPTARAKHIGVVNIPSGDTFFGKELRSLFTARPGYVMVGWDASALEARIEAHYTTRYDGGAYAKTLLEGDVHAQNANVWDVLRNKAKNGKYCLMYGGGSAKIASTLGKPESQGPDLYKAFWDENDALKQLKGKLDKVFAKRKKLSKTYIKGIDGRELYVRYKHALVNTLIQAGGSIAVKMAFVRLAKIVKLKGWAVKFLGFFHDEVQADVRADIADNYGKLSVECLKWAGQKLNLSIELDGEYKVGKSWADTH